MCSSQSLQVEMDEKFVDDRIALTISGQRTHLRHPYKDGHLIPNHDIACCQKMPKILCTVPETTLTRAQRRTQYTNVKFSDNQRYIELGNNHVLHARTQHIEI